MVIGVDIRCLQDSVLTGVGEYTWRILKTFHRQHPEVKLVGYCNAASRIALPAEASSLLSLVRSRWPNKLKNLGFSLGLAEPIDVSLKRAQGQLDVLWIPNPGFVRHDCFSGAAGIQGNDRPAGRHGFNRGNAKVLFLGMDQSAAAGQVIGFHLV